MNGNDTIESLTAAYLEGRLSPEEAERLLETIERDEQARRTLFEMKNLYDMGRMNPLDQRQIEAGWERLVRQTSIRSDENRTAGRTSDRTPLRRMARTALRYAAVALIALSAGFAMSRHVVLHRAAGYNEVAAEAKNHSEVVLSDGTRVTLNGEAYFDVSRDPRKPFVVHTERQRIRVLGTSFNVMAYDGDTFNIVTLLSGAVQLDVLGTEGSLLESVRMKPFEQCRFDTRTGELTATLLSDEDRNRTWTDGVFRFRDEPLSMIVSRLEKYYGIEIAVDDSLGSVRYTGAFPLEQKITEVLETLNFEKRFTVVQHGNDFALEKK